MLADPKDSAELTEALGWNRDEVRQVLSGFVLAELVEQRHNAVAGQFVVFEPNSVAAQSLRTSLEDSDNRYAGKVVRDKLALQLVLKRAVPHTLVFDADEQSSCDLMKQLFNTPNAKAAKVKRIAVVNTGETSPSLDWNERVGFSPDEVIARPCTAEMLFRAMDRLLEGSHGNTPQPATGAGSVVGSQSAVTPIADLSAIDAATVGVES